MKKLSVVLLLALFVVAFAAAEGQQEYPARDITDIVVWGAGGGTDTCNRVIMGEMSKILGVNINVTNVTGGSAGSVGLATAYGRAADGYTLCGLSESNTTTAVMVEDWDNTVDVWDFFIVGGSPEVVSVTPDLPYESIKELVDAARQDPGAIRAGASGAGSIHHVNLLAFENATGADFEFIPYDGSAPAQNAAMTGEVQLVITSAAEQAQLIRAGRLRPLAVLVEDAFSIGGQSIPSAFDSIPELTETLPISQAIGFAVRADAPDNVKEVLRDAFDEAMATDALKNFGEEQFYVLSGATGEEALEIMQGLQSKLSWALADNGLAVEDPASIGIPRP
jgi:tripartite-type tricarboxylate transporter receptor subunit TctC